MGKVNCKDKLVIDYSKFLKKQQNLWNHLFSFIVSNPVSLNSFALDVPLMVSVIAKAALYWAGSAQLEKVTLLGLSNIKPA